MRGLYEMAAKAGHSEEASRWLTRLAETDLSYSTVSYVYRNRQDLQGNPGRAVRMPLFSSNFLDWWSPVPIDESRKAGLILVFYLGPSNPDMQQTFKSRV